MAVRLKESAHESVTRSFAHKNRNCLCSSIKVAANLVYKAGMWMRRKISASWHVKNWISIRKDEHFSCHLESIKDGILSLNEILSYSLTERDTIWEWFGSRDRRRKAEIQLTQSVANIGIHVVSLLNPFVFLGWINQ